MKSKKNKRQPLVLASLLILLSMEFTPVVSFAAKLPKVTQQTESLQETSAPVETATETSDSESSTSHSSDSATTETRTSTSSTSSSKTEPTTTSTSAEKTKESASSESTNITAKNWEQPPINELAQDQTSVANATPYEGGESSQVILDPVLAVEEITPSNLKGYELPLLSSFKEVERAVVVAESLKQVGKTKQDFKQTDTEFSSNVVIQRLYQKLFQVDLGSSLQEQISKGKSRTIEEAEAGDLVFWQTTKGNYSKSGVYLGQGKYLLVAPEKETENKQQATVQIGDIYTAAISNDNEVDDALKVMNPFQELSLTSYGKQVLSNYSASFDVKKSIQTMDFIKRIGETARELGEKYDVFASVMIAQAILESGSGSSQLANEPYYNLFGVKGSFQGQSVTFSTKESDQQGQFYTISAGFRDYGSYQDSLKDYVQLLRQGINGNSTFYKPAWRSEAKNYLHATRFLTGKYATDKQYHNKLNSLIALYNLTQFDLPKTVDGLVIQSKSELPTQYQQKMKLPVYNGVNYNKSGSYPVGQCTWYVYNRLKQLGISVDEFMGNGGDWGNKGKALGYKIIPLPKAGRAISFQPGVAGADQQYGHVAFVEAVSAEGVLISESNVVNDQTISYRILPNSVAYSSGVTYIGY